MMLYKGKNESGSCALSTKELKMNQRCRSKRRGTEGTHPSFLHQVGDHDDDACVLLPHHPPEVLKGGLEGTLSSDVCLGFVVTLRDNSIHTTAYTTADFRYTDSFITLTSGDTCIFVIQRMFFKSIYYQTYIMQCSFQTCFCE